METANTLVSAGEKGAKRIKREALELGTTAGEYRLRSLHTFLEFLESVLVPLCEASLLGPSLTEFASALERKVRSFEANTKLLIHSIDDFNYGWSRDLGERIRDAFEAATYSDILADVGLSDNIWSLYAASFPPNNVLTHTVLAHELGHGIYQSKKLGDSLLLYAGKKVDEAKIDNLISLLQASSNISTPGTDPNEPEQLSLLGQIHPSAFGFIIRGAIYRAVASWIEELTCDIIGLCMFGPSFLFAQLHFLPITLDLDGFTTTHPSPRMRILLMISTLMGTDKGLGYRLSGHNQLIDTLENWRVFLSAKRPRPTHPVYEIAYHAVAASKSVIVSTAKSVFRRKPLRQLLYTRERFGAEVPELIKSLSDGLPINSYWDSLKGMRVNLEDIVSPMNAAWLFYIQDGNTNLRKLIPDIDEHDLKQRYYALVRKSLEYVDIKHEWNEHNGGA